MAEAPAQRKKLVQTLRASGRACGVPLVRDDAGHSKVCAFAEAIEASAGPRDAKVKARAAYAEYARLRAPLDEALLPEEGGQGAAGERGACRLRGKSFLLTQNWDFFGKAFPDGSPPAASPGALWTSWRVWTAGKKQELGVERSTSTVERSLHCDLEGRVHVHWKVDLKVALDKRNRAVLAFHGVLPDLRQTEGPPGTAAMGKKARGRSLLDASNRAHVYVWVPKEGSLFRGTNYTPFDDYRVMGKWIDDLWTDGKLSHRAYQDLALRVRVGYAGRKRDVEQVLADEREQWVGARIAVVSRKLQKLKAPSRSFPQVQQWEDSFLNLDFRWKVLLLWGDSASGKSTFAEGLFENPYIVTVEEATQLDLKGFNTEVHDGIVLDNVNSFGQLLQWRAVLQGRNAKSKGGQSATNMYAYTQYLFGVAIVATVDLDAPDAHLINSEHEAHSKWLGKNTVRVELPRGETFFDADRRPRRRVPNQFSLFAMTVKRRRAVPAAF